MFDKIMNAIASGYNEAVWIQDLLLAIFGLLVVYIGAYTVIGIFTTRKFKPTENYHKYAILIAARNEENVIGNLLDSIKKQDYPSEYLTVFVVADNCDDKTAQIAREKGAVCYERFDTAHRTKGFALQFLFNNIKKEYGIESFEGYFIFDADNLLNSDYITRMNEAFDEGEKIITSYRNTKNFDENWISFSYAIHWLHSIRIRHRARSVLRLATNIQGTGFLFASELVKDGWNYTSLTEDRAFTADAVAHGYPISYCDAAMFYDEQPVSIKVAFRQRLRWSKGHLLAFAEIGPMLFKNIFCGVKNEERKPKSFSESLRQRWASYDILAQTCPWSLVNLVLWLIVSVFMFSCFCYSNGVQGDFFDPDGNLLSKLLCWIFGSCGVSVSKGITAAFVGFALTFVWNIIGTVFLYLGNVLIAFYLLIAERKRLIKMPLWKKIVYSFTWTSFDLIGTWTIYFAVFKKVEWKVIPHTSTVTIDNIEGAKDSKNGNDQ